MEVVEGDAAGSLAGGIEPRLDDDGARAWGSDTAARHLGAPPWLGEGEREAEARVRDRVRLRGVLEGPVV
jgi:hypothetical protein